MAELLVAPAAALDEQHIDPVTGLPRYAVALGDLTRGMLAAQEKQRCLGVVDFVVLPDAELLRLAPVADRALRQEITRRLAAALRPQDRLYAAEHWEWVAVLADLPSRAPLLFAMIKLIKLFSAPFVASDGSLLSLQVACGSAGFPDDGDDSRHLVQSARIARLHAERSEVRHTAYDPAMERIDTTQRRLHAELPHALSGGPGLALHIQPQIDLASGACVGGEALLRWTLPDGTQVPPPQTMAAVERLGLRRTFTRWLLQQAIQIQHHLRAAGILIVLSVNLTASDLLDDELPELARQTIATWDIDPACLLFELTESMMIEDTEQVLGVLHQLRQLGLALSVDDFGTGYASMSYLKRLPVQEVKIDQMFVRQIETSAPDREIADSVVQLAHRLGMIVVAEGVETVAAAAILTQLGCDRGQGYLYAKALPLEDFVAWQRARQASLAQTRRPTGTSIGR